MIRLCIIALKALSLSMFLTLQGNLAVYAAEGAGSSDKTCSMLYYSSKFTVLTLDQQFEKYQEIETTVTDPKEKKDQYLQILPFSYAAIHQMGVILISIAKSCPKYFTETFIKDTEKQARGIIDFEEKNLAYLLSMMDEHESKLIIKQFNKSKEAFSLYAVNQLFRRHGAERQ